MTTISSSTSTASTSTSSTSTASNTLTADMETFLKLLTTQLKNQDPTDPMDPKEFTSQLVQFSQVEQQIQQTGKLEEILAALTSGKASDALAYIGQEVQAPGDTTYLEDGVASWSYGVPSGASSVTLNVYDSSGSLVYTTTGDASSGRHDFDWDGSNSDGGTESDGGLYTLEVVAKDSSGTALTTDTLVRGVVDAVETINGSTYLVVGQLAIDPDDVVLARKPT
ncbi:flagellar hook assembly protein FlgD [Ferrovibrio sp.]|uniref:flagellar hook assembly protein FlgD n=1 Tax=Ferrovibrio sp. TaxID=1917215 RepID=UPI0025C586C6|nr:flagellar hook assembly protein FlgD [Ferrovibrio sp.]MBX3453531.1 flagellar hook assembly protein FlgD [Ferrovibrio sp.]